MAEHAEYFILLTANLGAANLLPLPALDGGRLGFPFLKPSAAKRIDPEKEGMCPYDRPFWL